MATKRNPKEEIAIRALLAEDAIEHDGKMAASIDTLEAVVMNADVLKDAAGFFDEFDGFDVEEQATPLDTQLRWDLEKKLGERAQALSAAPMFSGNVSRLVGDRVYYFERKRAWFVYIDAPVTQAVTRAKRAQKKLRGSRTVPANQVILRGRTLWVGSNDGKLTEVPSIYKSARSNAKIVEVPNTYHAVQVDPPKKVRKKFPFEGYIDFQGIQIDVENVKGSTRRGTGPDGDWSTFMHAHYGEIRGTKGTDGDLLDVYVGDNHDSSIVVVVHQYNPWDGKYDEDKVILGCESVEEAIGLYKKQYDRPGFYRDGEYTAMPIGAFWRWVKDTRNKGVRVRVAGVRRITIVEARKRLKADGWSLDYHNKAYERRDADFGSLSITQWRHNGKGHREHFDVTWYTGDPNSRWGSQKVETLREAVLLANEKKPDSDQAFSNKGRQAALVGTDTASILAVSPEMLERLIKSGRWLEAWGQDPESADKLIRQHGGAVFHTGSDGKFDVVIPGNKGTGRGLMGPYGTAMFDGTITKLAHDVIKAAGWWPIGDGTTGGGIHSSDEGLYGGDHTSDIMDSAIADIVKVYKEAWGREPHMAELQGIWEFSSHPDVWNTHQTKVAVRYGRPGTPLSAEEEHLASQALVYGMDVEMDGGVLPPKIERVTDARYRATPDEVRALIKYMVAHASGDYWTEYSSSRHNRPSSSIRHPLDRH